MCRRQTAESRSAAATPPHSGKARRQRRQPPPPKSRPATKSSAAARGGAAADTYPNRAEEDYPSRHSSLTREPEHRTVPAGSETTSARPQTEQAIRDGPDRTRSPLEIGGFCHVRGGPREDGPGAPVYTWLPTVQHALG